MGPARSLLALWWPAGLIPALSWSQEVELEQPVVVQADEVRFGPGDDWTAHLTAPVKWWADLATLSYGQEQTTPKF